MLAGLRSRKRCFRRWRHFEMISVRLLNRFFQGSLRSPSRIANSALTSECRHWLSWWFAKWQLGFHSPPLFSTTQLKVMCCSYNTRGQKKICGWKNTSWMCLHKVQFTSSLGNLGGLHWLLPHRWHLWLVHRTFGFVHTVACSVRIFSWWCQKLFVMPVDNSFRVWHATMESSAAISVQPNVFFLEFISLVSLKAWSS